MTKTDPDSQLLLDLLQKRLRSAKRSQRGLERELNLGHGTIGNILRGRTELRMRHLKMLGEALSFDPLEILAEVFGRPGAIGALPRLTAAVTREELRDLILEALREIAPVIDSVWPLAEAVTAHRRAEDAASFGKVVLTP